MWLYYGLPLLTGYDLGAFGAAAVALGLNIGAILRRDFPRRHHRRHRNAMAGRARARPQSRLDTLRFVMLPQALRNVLPPMGTTTMYLIKDTALASAIGTPELLRIGQLVAVETFRPVETLTIVAILYFVVTYPVALVWSPGWSADSRRRGFSERWTSPYRRRTPGQTLRAETVLTTST